jgi:hypothetical protein
MKLRSEHQIKRHKHWPKGHRSTGGSRIRYVNLEMFRSDQKTNKDIFVVIEAEKYIEVLRLSQRLFQIEVSWVVTPCSVVVGYRRFGGSCCHNLHGEVDLWRGVV